MANTEPTTGILRGDIRLLHGETLLLFDPAADAYYKISERVANIVSYFSEDLSYSAMIEKLHYNGIETDEKELEEIRNFLHVSNLLIPRYGEVTIRQKQLQDQKKKTLLFRLSSAYLFFKFPPWRPENFFKNIGPFVSFLVSPFFLFLWIVPAVLGYLLALRDFGKVMEQFSNSLSWIGLVKYVFAIVVVKIIHEAAHSLAAIRMKCRVRGIGLGFIFFVPRLYTDTTDSWRLPRKQRLLIDGAGIISELIIGGIAALFWNILSPGICQSTMFYIFTISTLSTLLVNGNIFIRYDGYYILSDLIGIENLMKRSSDCVKQSWRWYFLRLGAPSGEKRKVFLTVYGTAAFVYRLFLYTSICFLIYCSFTKTLAVAMLILELYALLIYPMYSEIKTIWKLSHKSAGKAVWFILFLIAAIISCILFIPLGWGITLPGETVPAQRQYVIVEESGYLLNALPEQEQAVKCGLSIVRLESPQLQSAIEKIRRTIAFDRELFVQQELDENEFAKKEVTAQKIHSDRLALNELLRRKENLIIKAAQDGYFIPTQQKLSSGALLRRDTVIGEIVSSENIIYAYANDEQIGKIHVGQKGVATTADSLKEIPCIVRRIEAVAAKFTPSPALQPFGGPIATHTSKGNEFLPVRTLYRVELEFSNDTGIRSGRLLKVKLFYKEQLYTYLKKIGISFFRKEF